MDSWTLSVSVEQEVKKSPRTGVHFGWWSQGFSAALNFENFGGEGELPSLEAASKAMGAGQECHCLPLSATATPAHWRCSGTERRGKNAQAIAQVNAQQVLRKCTVNW